MPPQLALLLCLIFILYLFRRESKQRPISSALWIPLIWMLIVGSRPLPTWLGFGPAGTTYDTMMEGNPLERTVFLTLILLGFFVLFRRRISWSAVIANNKALVFLFLYLGISIVWSDFPWVSFKRWYKSLGNIVMALIILTEPDFVEALKSVVKRITYVLVPLSIVFIKYFPDIGRVFDQWSGAAENCGVSYNKNGLGYVLMICGFFMCWDTLKKWPMRKDPVIKYDFYINVILLGMIGWLFLKADSATSLFSFLIGVSMYVSLNRKDLKKSAKLVSRLAVFIFIAAIPLYLFGYDYLLSSAVATTGHGSTFWGRVELWKRLLQFNTDPIIGTGFESFWLGSRLSTLWSEYWWIPTEAHNGYLEIYLNSGWIGLILFAVVFLTVYKKSLRTMLYGSDYGIIRFAYLAMAIFYNVTEAALKGLSIVWLFFLIIAIDYRENGRILRSNEVAAFPGEQLISRRFELPTDRR